MAEVKRVVGVSAMVGILGEPYHFEFTQQRGHVVGRAPTQDDLIVFYVPDQREWRCVVDQLTADRI
jgi:hypothetical protein